MPFRGAFFRRAMAFSFEFSGSAEKQPSQRKQLATEEISSLSLLGAASLNSESQPHLPEPICVRSTKDEEDQACGSRWTAGTAYGTRGRPRGARGGRPCRMREPT